MYNLKNIDIKIKKLNNLYMKGISDMERLLSYIDNINSFEEFDKNKKELNNSLSYHQYNDVIDSNLYIKKIEFQINNYNQYIKIIKELEVYIKLDINWDGYNGKVPNNKDLKNPILFLDLLLLNKIYIPNVMLSGEPKISFYWNFPNNYIEIEFDYKGYSYLIDSGSNNFYGKDDNDIKFIEIKLLSKLREFDNV